MTRQAADCTVLARYKELPCSIRCLVHLQSIDLHVPVALLKVCIHSCMSGLSSAEQTVWQKRVLASMQPED